MLTVEALRRILGLVPHPVEGGYFVESYRSADHIPARGLPSRYATARAASTAIYYLLTPDTFSAMHRLASDEIFHFYLGDPVEMLHLHPDGTHQTVVLGPDLESGQRPQVIVPRNIWQGAHLLPGGQYALLGTTVAPGFDYTDYETAPRAPLLASHPAARALILALTRQQPQTPKIQKQGTKSETQLTGSRTEAGDPTRAWTRPPQQTVERSRRAAGAGGGAGVGRVPRSPPRKSPEPPHPRLGTPQAGKRNSRSWAETHPRPPPAPAARRHHPRES